MTVHAASAAPVEPGSVKIGWAGVGIMGLAMVRRLLGAGYAVTVWNRSPDKCAPLAAEGATVVSSPKELAEGVDIVLGMLADPEAALAVAEQLVEGLGPGKDYVDVSTIDVASAQRIAEMVHAVGAQHLEAPVSGSKQPAEQGALIFLCGGDEELFHRAGPLLDVMGKAKYFLGEVGNGARAKLAINMVMGAMMAGFSEGLALAAATGLKPEQLVEIAGISAIGAPMYKIKGPQVISKNFPPAFPLKHQQKDMRLALEMAAEAGLSLPVAAAALEQYKQAASKGLGDNDFAAVSQVVME